MLIKSSHFTHSPEGQGALLRTNLQRLPQDEGSVFAVMRLLGKEDAARTRVADVITERLSLLSQTLSKEVNVPRRFEQFLQALNQDIAQVAAQERRVPLSDVHIVLGVQQGNQLFISGIGNLHALFMNRTAKQRYVIYELGDQLKEQEDSSWDKLFSTVLDGELHSGDIFYIGSRVSEREISLAELQDILVTLPPSGALKRISQHLHLQTSYAALCFQVAEPMTGGAPKKVNPISSVEQLGRTKEQTEQLLGEQEPDVGRVIARITKPLLRRLSSPGTTGPRSTIKRLLRFLIQGIAIAGTYLFKAASWILRSAWHLLTHFPQVYDRLRRLLKNEPTPKQRLQHLIDRFNRLSRPTKIASLSFLAVIVLMAVSLRILSAYQTNQAEHEAQLTIISRIEDKQNEAQARLIYDDQEQARQLIEEALALLETLPGSTDEDLVSEWRAKLQTTLLTVQGIESVTPSTIAALDESSSESIQSLINTGNRLLALTGSKNLYELSELSGTLALQQTTNGSLGAPVVATEESEGTFLIVDDAKQLGRGTLASNTLTPIVSGTNDLVSVEDIAMYNDALYVLTADGDQITKMRARGDGYEAGTAWVTSSTSSLNDAQAITIDGDVYVLTNERILKYRSGHEQTFSYETIDPNLSNAHDIWTSTESTYLYILDPTQQRVIVLHKNGDLVTQYAAPELGEAVAFVVQEDQRRILIATTTSILSFPTTHLLQ